MRPGAEPVGLAVWQTELRLRVEGDGDGVADGLSLQHPPDRIASGGGIVGAFGKVQTLRGFRGNDGPLEAGGR